MSDEIKTNKLSIFLIKKEYDSPDKILKEDKNNKEHKLDDNNFLYTKDSFVYPPKWVKNFFLKTAEDFNLKNSSSRAIFLSKINVNENEQRYFAIPFGMGYHMLNSGSFEERFGLKIVLNAVDETMFRSIDKKNMSNVPKQSKEQISNNSEVADFGIDIEQDLILGVTGKSKIADFGKTITGKDSFNISVKENINSISDLLVMCYEYFQKKDYKNNFGWIDQISEIKSKPVIKKLNDKLIENIKENNLEKIWMAVPEIIEWEDVEGFNFSFTSNEIEKKDDIYLVDYLKNQFSDDSIKSITIDNFKNNSVICYSSSNQNVKYQWKAYNCLYSEIEDNNKIFLLTNGKWYQIQNDFLKQVNDEYKELLKKNPPIQLPDFSQKNEGDYNIFVNNSLKDVFLMDKKNISYGGGYSKIEFCDLYSKSKDIIHIKIYGGSSVLSHLFNQGLVSGELFKAEKKFRELVNEKLGDEFKLENIEAINASDYKVIYGIISHLKEELNIPFFSKVSLKNAKKRLEMLGYQVYITKIQGNESKK